MDIASADILSAQLKYADSRIEAAKQATATTSASSAKNAKTDARLREVSQEFTAVLLGQMFKAMQTDIDCDGLGRGGAPEQMFREMSIDEYAKEIAKGQDLGLADLVYRSLAGREYARQAYLAGTSDKGRTGNAEQAGGAGAGT